jgi:hypothetical protein
MCGDRVRDKHVYFPVKQDGYGLKNSNSILQSGFSRDYTLPLNIFQSEYVKLATSRRLTMKKD